MTRAQFEELSGAEVLARLVNRGVSPDWARYLVDRRNHDKERDVILRVLRAREAA